MPVYRPRTPDQTPLFQCLQTHLADFLERAEGAGGLPPFVELELRRFLHCGVHAHGFARVRCDACGHDRLVAFSCKGRGFCPSCGGRRMADTAAYLVDTVLKDVPVRQWVLTLPMWLRRTVARNSRLCSRVLKIFTHAIGCHLRTFIPAGHYGAVTVIQRFGSGLNVNPHFHTVVPDGLYVERPDGEVVFRAVPSPTPAQLQRMLVDIMTALRRLLKRLGYGMAELIDEPVAWHACLDASIGQRQLLGKDAGAPIEKIRQGDPRALSAQQPLCARLDGFTLHAGVTVEAHDRPGLERLCRYVTRPPLAQDRVSIRPDGNIGYTLSKPWRDGTTELSFAPLDFIARLAALIPPPRANLVRYHGVFAPAARLRSKIVGQASPQLATALGHKKPDAGKSRGRRNLLWAELMRRVFGIDVLVCPECQGHCRVIACIDDPAVIRKILEHLGRPSTGAHLHPARGPPQLEFVDAV